MEAVLLGVAAALLLAQVLITMSKQRSQAIGTARMRILGNAHSHRDLEDRMYTLAMAMQYELHVKSVALLVYLDDEECTTVDSAKEATPVMSWKEARILDDELHSKVIDVKKISDRSHVAKLLTSYQVRYVMPLNHADQRVGYLFIRTKHKLSTWQENIIDVSRHDIAHAVASALNTHRVHSRNSVLEQKVALATDVDSRSGDQVTELENARNEFVSMASHQLRTPLTSIKGYLSMVLEGDAGEITKEQRKLLSEAFLSSERMVRLISDFLNVSRIQTGKFQIDAKDTDITKIIRQEAKQLEVNAKARGLTIDLKLPETPVVVSVDESKIRQVLMNFIDNAIYYSPEKTTITVELTETKQQLSVKVIDHGIGVPLAEQEKLFEKFFRASNARMQRPDGTGVGLYLAKEVIDGHNGKIIFESKPGQGSTFGFSLPIK